MCNQVIVLLLFLCEIAFVSLGKCVAEAESSKANHDNNLPQPNAERDVVAEMNEAVEAGTFSLEGVELGYMDENNDEASKDAVHADRGPPVAPPASVAEEGANEGGYSSGGDGIGGGRPHRTPPTIGAGQNVDDLDDSFGRRGPKK